MLNGLLLRDNFKQSEEILNCLGHFTVWLCRSGICDSFHHFFVNCLFIIIQVYTISLTFSHLSAPIKPGYFNKVASKVKCLRFRKNLSTIEVIKPSGKKSGNLKVLLLIFSNRNFMCPVNKNVSCHKNRICKQACINIIRILSYLLFE